MEKKTWNLPPVWMEPAEGTAEWYIGMYYGEGPYDVDEAEEMVHMGLKFEGNQIYFLHYPDGTVYAPLERRENVYYERPVWDQGRFGIAAVDFVKGEIAVYSYVPGQKPEILHVIRLSDIEDCYNLRLTMSPLTLGRQKDHMYEILWPEKKVFTIGDGDSMVYRDGNILYFSRWLEEPKYREYVVAVDIRTGKELSKKEGSLHRMPNGSFWLV